MEKGSAHRVLDMSRIMEEDQSEISFLNVNNSTLRNSLDAGLRDPAFLDVANQTFLHSKDFSLSSIISNFSQLLDGKKELTSFSKIINI